SRRAERNSTSKPVELFKLHLGNMPEKEKPALPKGLEYKRAIIDYLTEIETVATRWPNVNFIEQVLLIMTVLAEFSEQANASIRECAYKAGLISTQYADTLQLTTEYEFIFFILPKAAVIYCMRTLKEHMITEVGLFMIVDCGGGTVDFTTRELLENNRLGEITEYSDDFLQRNILQEFCRHVKLLFTSNRKDFKTYELDIEEGCLVLKQYVTKTSKAKLEKDN
ncbi:35786_t:CDS:2, partial [Gigaspora margarita]